MSQISSSMCLYHHEINILKVFKKCIKTVWDTFFQFLSICLYQFVLVFRLRLKILNLLARELKPSFNFLHRIKGGRRHSHHWNHLRCIYHYFLRCLLFHRHPHYLRYLLQKWYHVKCVTIYEASQKASILTNVLL